MTAAMPLRRGEPATPGAEPGIAGVTGCYRETPPDLALRGHFSCFWSSTLPPGPARAVAVLPDGCVDILWRDGALCVVGPDVTAAHPDLAPGAHVLGARFRAGAARAWLGLPLSELVGRAVALEELWGGAATDMAARVQEAGDPLGQARAFQQELLAASRRMAPAEARAAELFRLCGLPGEDGARVQAVQDRLGLSERSVRRLCHDHFGYGAKTLERILRFQRFYACLRRLPEAASLAVLAAEAGYADQAHLGREVQALCGMTPARLRQQLRADLAA